VSHGPRVDLEKLVVLTQATMPAVTEALGRRLPGIEIVELGSRCAVRDDAEPIMVTGPRAPRAESGWRAQSERVPWVHFWSTGVDGFPEDFLRQRVVTCSRGFTAGQIAEYVLAVILSATKDLPAIWNAGPRDSGLGTQRPEDAADQGSASRPVLSSLAGKTVGLLGFGAIGQLVARRIRAFDASVVALRRRPYTWPHDTPEGVELVGDLHSLMARADHLVVCAPLTTSTRHLLDRSAFAKAKPGIHVVNVARGPIIDHEALLEAIELGTVSRASLDVVEPDPLPPGHPLLDHPAVFITPHVSWSGGDGHLDQLVDNFVENLARWQLGEPLHGLVDTTAGY